MILGDDFGCIMIFHRNYKLEAKKCQLNLFSWNQPIIHFYSLYNIIFISYKSNTPNNGKVPYQK